ncbi:hypothetical protein FHU36_004005 [Nonomuraea muscovyensis]|uniref:SdpI family protein n=1 Tax=Nonomuraea muscovyensis TaxID=1124761 RepID=A0A7X0C4S8_9ACTN|nr:SdpI family protein [Nonomuraea muscovyensis]MBB6347460.1 hypothetical protein [Nonomuraea muscovyensis]
MDVLPPLLVFAGLAAGIVGCLGLAGRLPRNNIAGVRTPTTMRSDTAFRANKAAGVPPLTGGGVALTGAVAAWLLPTDEGVLTVVIVAAIGMLALTILGGVTGVRAAKAVPDQEPDPPTG